MSAMQKRNVEQLLFNDITQIIDESKRFVAKTINSTISLLYWKIGKRINHDILQSKRAEYGKKIVVSLTRQLTWTHIIALLLNMALLQTLVPAGDAIKPGRWILKGSNVYSKIS